jgi:hypothetical protein
MVQKCDTEREEFLTMLRAFAANKPILIKTIRITIASPQMAN